MASSIKHRSNNETFTFETPSADEPIEILNEFYWTEETEAHVSRRKEIIKRYPQVTSLTGYEPRTKWIVLGIVVLQLSMAYYLRHTPIFSLKFVAIAYIIGATSNQAIFLAIHELSHNLLFKKPFHNRMFAIFTNLPIGVPYSASFQPYHQLHHKFLGDRFLDTDLPTKLEGLFLSNLLGKVFFACCQIFFYALRPMFITQIKFTYVHVLNVIFQVVVDYLMVRFWGANALWYFIMSSFLSGSLHPCAGHFIAEHYVLGKNNKPRKAVSDGKIANISPDQIPAETYSYYGVLNRLTFNVGYHNEHHDFPFIAWSKLPVLREMAAEFYDPLPQVNSWCGVIWYFVTDDVNTLWNRVKRAGNLKDGSKVDI